MITEFVGHSASRFDQRFFLTALIPTAVFAPATAAVVIASTYSIDSFIEWYLDTPLSLQVFLWVAAAATIWFISTLLASQLYSIVRLFEGYPILRLYSRIDDVRRHLRHPQNEDLRPIGLRSHRRRFEVLRRKQVDPASQSSHDPEPAGILADHYPSSIDRIMPTRLGNILRAAEDYGWDRYGFDTIYLWPRLATVLPDDYLGDVERSTIEYQTPLVVSLWAATLAGVSFVAIRVGSAWIFLAVFLISILFSYVAYVMSFRAARDYGDFLNSAVDLYRAELLAKWWPELLSVEDDRARLEALRLFVVSGTNPTATAHVGSDEPLGQSDESLGQDDESSAGPKDRGTSDEVPISESSADESRDRVPIPARGVRLSVVVLLVTVVMSLMGFSFLDHPVSVLRARDEIAAFDSFAGQIYVDRIPRGTLNGSSHPVAMSLVELEGAIALHEIADDAVIEDDDASPPVSDAKENGLIVELARRRSEVAALDLRKGDEVLLLLPATETPRSCTEPGGGLGPAMPPVEAHVLVVKSVAGGDTSSVTVQMDNGGRSEQIGCLSGITEAEIVRPPCDSKESEKLPAEDEDCYKSDKEDKVDD